MEIQILFAIILPIIAVSLIYFVVQIKKDVSKKIEIAISESPFSACETCGHIYQSGTGKTVLFSYYNDRYYPDGKEYYCKEHMPAYDRVEIGHLGRAEYYMNSVKCDINGEIMKEKSK